MAHHNLSVVMSISPNHNSFNVKVTIRANMFKPFQSIITAIANVLYARSPGNLTNTQLCFTKKITLEDSSGSNKNVFGREFLSVPNDNELEFL